MMKTGSSISMIRTNTAGITLALKVIIGTSTGRMNAGVKRNERDQIQDMSEKIEVSKFSSKFYDEQAEAKLMPIHRRSWCFKHSWINASLYWSKKHASGEYWCNIEERHADENFCREWGTGYGGIRYCRNCKLIDCIHFWSKSITYIEPQGDYLHFEHFVKHCEICKKRILTGTMTVNKPTDKALEMIRNIGGNLENYGSWFHCEFPVQVSILLDESECEAERYIRKVLSK